MEHLAIIFKDAGYEDILLGNLYIGGCSLDTHWSNINSGAVSYDFYVNSGNGWTNSKSAIQTGIDYADWDVITIQQVSQDSGRPTTFRYLQNIIDHVKTSKPDAKIYWHMTWAYQSGSSHSGFANYGKNQMTMYSAITDAVKNNILTNSSIDGFIPSGTAVQNLRGVYGDTLTRDGYHLSYGIGRYTAALMWYKQLTGADISDITAVPSTYAAEITRYLAEIKQAVNDAYEKPLETTGDFEQKDLTVMTDADREYLISLGLDPAKYELLDLGIVYGAYYYSNSSPISDNYSALHVSESNCSQFIATDKFTSQMLPVGSVVRIAEGYRYRLEGWQTMGVKNELARRDNSTENFIVSEDLYEKYNFVAFNISRADSANVSLKDGYAFRIYIPVTEPEAPVMTQEDRDYLTSNGLNPDDYEKLALNYTLFSYYNATSDTSSNLITSRTSTASNLVNYLGTRIISKEEMPVGSVIRVDSEYQYRPERFVELNEKASSRGKNIKTAHVVVDASWWKDYNYVGFNLAFKNTAVVSLETGAHLVIYVLKAN